MKQQKMICDFIEKVQWMHEVEYGDFKRKLGLYLNRLEEKIPEEEQSLKFQKTLLDLRSRVIYSPTGDIEATREDILVAARNLLEP